MELFITFILGMLAGAVLHAASGRAPDAASEQLSGPTDHFRTERLELAAWLARDTSGVLATQLQRLSRPEPWRTTPQLAWVSLGAISRQLPEHLYGPARVLVLLEAGEAAAAAVIAIMRQRDLADA